MKLTVKATSGAHCRDLVVGDKILTTRLSDGCEYHFVVDDVVECHVEGLIKYETVFCHMEVSFL